MRSLRYILSLVLAALLLAGCRSGLSLKKSDRLETKELLNTLLNEPPVTEFTSSISLNVNGTRLSGQLRMRRDRSIQINASMLGLVEVARIEMLPDMVIVMDRVHNLYSVCHYAFLPYHNESGLDFDAIQALLWNRIFSPGMTEKKEIEKHLSLVNPDENGGISFKEHDYGYLFETDGKSRLNAVSKKGSGYDIRVDYSCFSSPVQDWDYPQEMRFHIGTADAKVDASVKLSSLSVERKNWPDRTQVSSRMKEIPLEELLDNLGL